MPYTPTNWEDLPSVETPITAAELNRIEAGVDAAVEFADTHPGAVDPHTQYQKESEKGQAGGYASLDGSGTVPAAQIPAIAITTYLGSVANQSAMLALSGQVGDWAIRSDLGQTAIITGSDPTQLSSWTFLAYPASPVVSVNSETGAVVLDATDVGAEPAGAIATHESTYDHTDIPDPTGAAEQYVWTADGSGSASWQPGGGSAPTDSYWKFSNLTADAAPGSGKFRFNDPLRSGTSFIYVDNTTLAGLNISNFATLLANGDQVFIQPKADAASRVRYTVTGPAVDGTGYWKIPVSVSVAATGSEISNNAEVLLLWNIAALGGTPSTHIHDDRYYTESEIDTLLSGKSSTGHVHDDRYYTESETDTLLSNKADLVGGLVPTSQIPAIAVTEYLGAAANQAAMLALVGQKGDFCTRTDTGTNWVITGNDPTQLADWTQLSYPTAPVTSVNSQTGAVVLNAGDVGAAPVSHGTHLTDGDKGDITVGGSGTTFTIDNNAVTNAKAADMAGSTIKGRASGGGTGDPQDLTGTQVAAILPNAAAGVKGLVTPPGGTGTFYRADGSFATPSGGGGVRALLNPQFTRLQGDIGYTNYNLYDWSGSAADLTGVTANEVLILKNAISNPTVDGLGSSTGPAAYGYSAVLGPVPSSIPSFATSTYAQSGTTATIKFSADHYLESGDIINIVGVHANVNGTRIVASQAGSRQITVGASTSATITETAAVGTVSLPYGSITRAGSTSSLIEHPIALRPELPGGWSWRPGDGPNLMPYGIKGGVQGVVWEAPLALSTRSRTSNVATLVTTAAHGLSVGDFVSVQGIGDNSYNAWRTPVLSVPNSTTITYASPGTNETTTAASGYFGRSNVPGIQWTGPSLLNTSGGFSSLTAGSTTGLHVRYGSFSAVALAFFTASANITVLPEASRFVAFGQIARGSYGYGVVVDSAGTVTLRWFEGTFPGTVLATLGTTVAAGDTVFVQKFGTQWTVFVATGLLGTPKGGSILTYGMPVGPPLNGYADIFGTMVMGFLTNASTGKISDIRFYG